MTAPQPDCLPLIPPFRAEAESLFRDNAALLFNILQEAGGGLWYWQADSQELHLSASARALLGLNENDSLLFSELLEPADQLALQQSFNSMWLGLPGQSISFRLRRAENEPERWFELSGCLLADPHQRKQLTGLLQAKAPSTIARFTTEMQQLGQWMELLPEGILLARYSDGVVFQANRAISHMLGWPLEQFIGKRGLELNIWESAEQLASLRHEVRIKQQLLAREVRLRARDGQMIDTLMSAQYLEMQGETFLLITLINNSEAKRTEAALRNSEKKFAEAFRMTPDAVVISDRQSGRFIEVNASFSRRFGWDSSQIVGKSSLELGLWVDPQDRQRLLQGISNGKCNQVEVWLRGRDGSTSLNLVSADAFELDERPTLVLTLHDITQQRAQEQALKASEEKFTGLFQSSMEPCCVARPGDGTFFEVNRSFCETFGWTAQELIGRTTVDIQFHAEPEQANKLRQLVLEQGQAHNMPLKVRRKDGQVLQCLGSARVIQIGTEQCLTVSLRDITQQLESEAALKASQEKFSKSFQASPDSIIITDMQTSCYLEVNDSFTRMSGYDAEEVIGKSYLDTHLWLDEERHRQFQQEVLKHGRIRNYEMAIRRKDGSALQVSVSAEPMELNGKLYMLTTSRDISALKDAEARIQHLAYHDSLTGLPNRALLSDRLTQKIALFKRHGMRGALLFIDLDRFKHINDSLGHAAGDALLKTIAARLESSVRLEDTVARLGGDEFVVLLSGLEGSFPEVKHKVLELTEKLRALLAEPILLDGHELQVTPSIGIALLPDHGENPSDLLKHADIALYRAKDAGRNAIILFRNSMLKEARERLRLENDLRLALGRDEFILHFQPQIDARSGLIVGAEVLLRWEHPTLGGQSPAAFIPVLEESGLIIDVGGWVLTEACNACMRLVEEGLIDRQSFSLSVNISPRQFGQAEFAEIVGDALRRSGLPARMLKLEVTESIVIQNLDETIAKMHQLKQVGVSFSMDDFGTGYSSLTYLKRLPVDVLKIDQSFVRDATLDPNDAEIIRAIVAMALSLGLEIIAEGVERTDQLEFLQQQGCHLYQGYLFSRPLPISEFRNLLLQGSPNLSTSC